MSVKRCNDTLVKDSLQRAVTSDGERFRQDAPFTGALQRRALDCVKISAVYLRPKSYHLPVLNRHCSNARAPCTALISPLGGTPVRATAVWPQRRLIELFKIEHPLILAPMAGFGTV